MKTWFVLLGTLVCGAAFCMGQTPPEASATPAATKPAGKENAWVTRTFRLPAQFGWDLPEASLEDKPKSDRAELEPLPEPGAPDDRWVDCLRRSTATIGGQLRDFGLDIPEGSLFLWDRPSGTLVVRTRESALKSLANFAHSQLKDVKRNLVFSMDVMEVKPELGRRWLEDTCTIRDHTAVWHQAEAGLKKGDVKVQHQMLLQTTSGNRVEGTCGIEQLHPNEISLHGRELVQWYLDAHPAGFSVALDAVLGPDDTTVDANIQLRVPMGEPQLRQELLSRNADGNVISAPMLDLPLFQLESQVTVQAGTPMLIGAWKTQRMGHEGSESFMQVAFLRCERQMVLPMENRELERRMSAHAESVSPIANVVDDQQREGFGMETRVYRVPPTFLSGSGEPTADATKILESQGVPFPAGAKAVFRQSSSSLVVKNVRENLEMIEDYIGVHGCFGTSRQVVVTLEIVEGGSEAMRAMQQEAMREVDHGGMLKRLRQRGSNSEIRFLDDMRMITRSGQRVKLQSGIESTYVASVDSTISTSHTATDTAPSAEEVPLQSKPAEQSNAKETTADVQFSPHYDARMVGTILELDPIINSDGITVQVQLMLEKHFALPVMYQESGSEGKKFIPSVRFHFAKIPAVVSMNSGTTRLIGMWKPKNDGTLVEPDVLQAAFLRVDLVPFVDWP